MASQRPLPPPIATYDNDTLPTVSADATSYHRQNFYKYLELAKKAHVSEIEQLREENQRLNSLVKSWPSSGGEADAKGYFSSEGADAQLLSDNETGAADSMSDLCDVVLLERVPCDAPPPATYDLAMHRVESCEGLQVLDDLSMDRLQISPIAELRTSCTPINSVEVKKSETFVTRSRTVPLSPVQRPKSVTGRLVRPSSMSLQTGASLTWSQRVGKQVNSIAFEMVMTSLVAASALLVLFHTQYEGIQICYDLQYHGCERAAEDVWPNALQVFEWFDWVFGIIFVCEALLKIACLKFRYFLGKGAAWNWLDLLCVLSFLVDTLAAYSNIDGSKLRLMRLIRLVRLHRIIRRLEALDALYIMATAIKGMSRILIWAMLLLLGLLSTCALLLTQFLQMQILEGVHAEGLDDTEKEVKRELYEYFGTFTRSLLSMFELTLGNWPPVARLLCEYVSEWFMPLSLLHKMSIGFAVVGVINGVIMQETFKVAAMDDQIMVRQKKKLSAAGRHKLVRLFDSLDKSKDGLVDLSEFEMIAEDPEVKTWLASMDIETDDLKTLFVLLDEDCDGVISVEELCQRIPRVKGAARCIDTMVVKYKLNEVVNLLNCNSKILADLSASRVVLPDLSPTNITFAGYTPPSAVSGLNY